MSNDLPTQYKKQPNQQPNLAKLPEHIREAITTHVPMRQSEVHGRLRLYTTRTVQIPTARVSIDWSLDKEFAPESVAQLSVLDPLGREAILHIELDRASLKRFIDRANAMLAETP